MRRWPVVVLAMSLVLSGCPGTRPPHWQSVRTYTVQPGDTLYSIAFRHGVDWRQLAAWNDIAAPRYTIRPGQELRLTSVRTTATTQTERTQAATPRAPVRVPEPAPPRVTVENTVRFIWPTEGEVVARFNDANATGKGIAIGGRSGQAIVAAASGRVVYTGSGLIGYGKLIIIKHNNQLLSAYAHNRDIVVREGDEVQGGQRIATMGEGPGRRTMLHFEIRVDGQAVDPMSYLPAR